MDQETIKLLRDADWAAIRRSLLVYTTWRASNYRWSRGGIPELAEGYTVEDVVQEVIAKTLSGVRRWAPNKGPLLPWLHAQCNSVIDALAKSAPHRREMNILEVDYLFDIHSPDSLEIVLEQEAETLIQQKIEGLVLATDGEPELQEVLKVVLGGCEPWPRHIALTLGVSVREIDNRLKRLRRRASKFAYNDVHQSH